MKCLIALLCILIVGTLMAHAEVIELDGTIKSIDQDQMAITIVRKTPKGERELELEIAKNAGDISGLKEGDRVSFAYNPDVEIITKIANAAEAEAVEALQGVWVATAVERNGTMMSKKELQEQGRRIVIEGDVYRQEETRGNQLVSFSGKFSVDSATGAFDFVGKGPKGHPMKLIGLYEIRGDTLRLCYRADVDGKAERPTDFKAREETPNWSHSYTCKRLPLE